jgi:hypothetical protein
VIRITGASPNKAGAPGLLQNSLVAEVQLLGGQRFILRFGVRRPVTRLLSQRITSSKDFSLFTQLFESVQVYFLLPWGV